MTNEDEKYFRSIRFHPVEHSPETLRMLQDKPDMARGQLPGVLPGNVPPDGGNDKKEG